MRASLQPLLGSPRVGTGHDRGKGHTDNPQSGGSPGAWSGSSSPSMPQQLMRAPKLGRLPGHDRAGASVKRLALGARHSCARRALPKGGRVAYLRIRRRWTGVTITRRFFSVSKESGGATWAEYDLLGDPIPPHFGKRGRPPHVPTAENRQKMRLLLAFDLSNQRIARALGITGKTLSKHYFRELRQRAGGGGQISGPPSALTVGQPHARGREIGKTFFAPPHFLHPVSMCYCRCSWTAEEDIVTPYSPQSMFVLYSKPRN